LIGIDINKAISLLKQGEVVGVPTETVYGLAGNALNEDAVSKIFYAKQRPSFDPLIIHLPSYKAIEKYVIDIPDKLAIIGKLFMPGPVSLLLRKKDIIPDLVTSGSDLVAVRVPSHPLMLDLLSSLNFPLAAPSANPFGYISPTSAQHVFDQLGTKIPYILDGGECHVGLESTIIGMVNDEVVIYRKGGLPIEQIQELVGSVKINDVSSSNPMSPGMLISHYAPKVKLQIADIKNDLNNYSPEEIGIVSFSTYYDHIPKENQIVLSEKGDFAEAARNLFSGLRKLDSMDISLILAEYVPDVDLGRAINDRLRRAAGLG
jgi:L-threonylcarbamoyladenylate synthase